LKIAVINESAPTYNLGAHKIENYYRTRGDEVVSLKTADLLVYDCDLALVSVIFTWHLPQAVKDINTMLGAGITVEVGGPAATAMSGYLEEQTGLKPHLGLDERFEHVPGDDYKAVFTSRGCPWGCKFCIVKDMEGLKMIEYEDYPIPVGKNPFICDNNILLTSWEHQVRFVERMKSVKNLDINSGFDCRIFINDMQRYFDLYSQLKMETWRFAYDKPAQRWPLKKSVDFLHAQGVGYRQINVFCLMGFDTDFEQTRRRLQWLVDIGTSPYPMRYRPLDSLKSTYTPPGWGEKDQEMLFGYYGVGWHWKSFPWEEYKFQFKDSPPEDPNQPRLFEVDKKGSI